MDAIAAAGRRWPGVKLPPSEFSAWLSQRGLDVSGLGAERVEALFLACACVKGVPGAHVAFDETWGPTIAAAAARVRGGAPAADVTQQVRVRLLSSTPDRGAKLAEYSGSGDFAGWLRTVTLRVALSMRPATPPDDGHDEALARIVSAMPNAEQLLLKAQNAQLVKAAFGDALAALEPRQRTVLKMSVVDGLSIDEIAPCYSVHRATVARWLDAVRRELNALTTEALRRRARLSPPELESLLGELGSQLNLSLDRLLESGR